MAASGGEPPPGARRRVAVVGGGVTGLAAAWYASRAGADVTLVEATERVGGKIRTEDLAGVAVEAGPDTFLARVPWAVDLCRELGLGDELVAPATGRAYVWARGRLAPLPSRQVLGVPTAFGPLLRSGVVSAPGVARAALDLVLPARQYGDDPSVADVVGHRMGREVLDRLVEPLVGGINAGVAERLSLAATARPLYDAALRSASLVRGLAQAPPPPGGPLFLGLAGGMQRLVERLAAGLDDARLGAPVRALTRARSGGYRLHLPGDHVEAASVILAVPAGVAARLVSDLSPAAASALAGVRAASVVTATLAFPSSAVGHSLDGAGMLVPRVEGRLMTACTWWSSKWPALAKAGSVLLRASAGRDGDERALDMADGELVEHLSAELAEAVGVRGRPTASLVSRWPGGFPQYEVGHRARIGAADAGLAADAPGVAVAGASYRGLGIAACIEQARKAGTRAAAPGPARP